MVKKRVPIYLVAGAAAMLIAAHNYESRYSNEAIWKRQRVLIEARSKGPDEKKANYARLRAALDYVEKKGEYGSWERCATEIEFEESMRIGGGDLKKAIEDRSFFPFAECKTSTRLMKSVKDQWYGWVGAVVFLLGVAGLFSKKRQAGEGGT